MCMKSRTQEAWSLAVGAEAISTEHIQVRVVMAWTREEAVGVTTALGACDVPGAVLSALYGLVRLILIGTS